jgi:hypothetical protein
VIALGEHAELETQLVISGRRAYINELEMGRFVTLSTQVGEFAHGLLRSLETAPS